MEITMGIAVGSSIVGHSTLTMDDSYPLFHSKSVPSWSRCSSLLGGCKRFSFLRLVILLTMVLRVGKDLTLFFSNFDVRLFGALPFSKSS